MILHRLSDLVKNRIGPHRVILELDLNRGMLWHAPTNPWQAIRSMNSPSMGAVREGLREAAKDPNVVGLVVHVGTCPLTIAQSQELAQAIEQFGQYHPSLAFSESYGEMTGGLPGMSLASAAHQVWLQPSGTVAITGALVQITLLKGLLNKLGIEPEVAQRKDYKTAAEQLGADQISEANREMTCSIGHSVVDSLVADIASRRNMDPQQVWQAIDQAPLSAQQAQQLGLIDRIGYRDEVYDDLLTRWDGKSQDLRFVHRYDSANTAQRLVRQVTDRVSPVISVIDVQGAIEAGRGEDQRPGSAAGADVICEQLRAAARDEHTRAVIVRVESPGGSAVASDMIWREVHRVRDSGRPVVACLQDLAASGGYYVAMGAQEIVAQPSTLTGSIGVWMGKMVIQQVLDKLGLVHESYPIGAQADLFSAVSHFDPQQWQIIDRWLDQIYDDFTHKAATDRQMAYQDLEDVAQGRVWTGAQAQERGLIDHLGGMDLAIERACQLAGIQRKDVVLKSVPVIPVLSRFRPAENSESVSFSLPGLTNVFDAESLLVQGAAALGLGWQGVLSMPWRISAR